jgi:hypothetical protein
MSNGYWTEKEQEVVLACAEGAAHWAKRFSLFGTLSGVLCLLALAVAIANAHDLSNWMSLINVVCSWWLYRTYRLDRRLEHLYREACHHATKSVIEPHDKADWHVRRMHDCADFLRLELGKIKTKEIER